LQHIWTRIPVCVAFTVPWNDLEPIGAPQFQTRAGEVSSMPAPVLVVHQDAEICSQMLGALRAAQCEAAGFHSSMTALNAIENGSRARVLVTQVDFGAGTLNGDALARMLRLKRPKIKVVYVDHAENQRHITVGGPFLPYPIDLNALTKTVRHLLTAGG
jgi:DNA-binding NtrC family response regulator